MVFEAVMNVCCDLGRGGDVDVHADAGDNYDSKRFVCNDVDEHAKSIIEQIFGTDVLPGNEVRKLSKKSIFSRLERFVHEDDEKLDPCDVINSTLSELVSCVQACSMQPKGAAHSYEFYDVEKRVCAFVDSNEEASRRAGMIRDVATRAESRLEFFYARRLLSCKQGVNSRMGYMQRIRQAACDFPYVDNYVEMVQKEYEVLREVLSFHTLRGGQRCVRDKQEDCLRVAFCGSGPLPLSGVLLSAYSNVHVTLIDCDEEAVAISRKLLGKWEREQIIPSARIEVICADATALSFTRSKQMSKGASEVQCDLLFVAALLSKEARGRLIGDVEQRREDAPLVVVRSAHGLTARVAYDKADVGIDGSGGGGAGCGRCVALVVPEVHISSDGDVADEDDGTAATHVFNARILNSLEVFAWPRV